MDKHQNCIFLIDDDEITNKINTFTLQEVPFCNKVLSFTDSDEAYKYLNNHKLSDFPQVIFVDYNIPFSTANEITAKVKDISSSIKTVILTAYINPEQIREIGQNTQIDDLIFKPLTQEKIIESFKKMKLI